MFCADQRGAEEPMLHRFRDEMIRERLLRLMTERAERERPGGRWILFEPFGNKQIGDSVELSDTDLQHQRHGLVIRGMRLLELSDEVDRDAVVCSGAQTSIIR